MASHWTKLILLFLIVVCTGEDLQAEERVIEGHNPEPTTLSFLEPKSIAALATLPYERLPRSIQRIVRKIGDNAHWCCSVPTTKLITHSSAVLRYHVTSHQESYYKGCGWWGWSRCKVYKTVYKHATHYGYSYRSTTVPVTCPNRKVVCCAGYLMVAEHCLPISELEKVKGDLLKLHELGEI